MAADPRIAIDLTMPLSKLVQQASAVGDVTAAEVRRALEEVKKSARAMRKEVTKEQRLALRAAEEAARQQAAAQQEVARRVLELERARMSASQRAAAELEDEVGQLRRLADAGADAAEVERLRVLTVERGAARIAAARQRELAGGAPGGGVPAEAVGATQAYAAAQRRAASGSAALADASRNLALQLPDVISQLSAGAPASQVFVQQGLQVVQGSMHSLSGVAGTLVSVLAGPVGWAMAAAAAAAVLLANEIDKSADAQRSFYTALEATDHALQVGNVRGYAEAQRDMADAVRTAQEALALERGELSQLEVQQWRAVQAVKEAARAATLEAGANWARLEVQRQELEARIQANDFTILEKAQGVDDAARARLKVLREQLPIAEQQIGLIKDRTEARQLEVFEIYEELDAERQRQQGLERQQSAAVKGQQEAARQLRAQSRADAEERARLLAAEEARRAALADVQRQELEVLQSRAARTGEIADLEAATEAQLRMQINALAERADAQVAAGLDAHEVAQSLLVAEEEARLAAEERVAEAKRLALEQEKAARQQWVIQQAQLANTVAQNSLQAVALFAQQEVALRSSQADQLRDHLEANRDSLSKSERRRLRAALRDQNEKARKAFRVQQGSQVSQAVMAGSVAVLQGFAQLGPVGGAAFATSIAALTTAQIAAILRQKPPVMDYGGIVPLSTDSTTHTMVAARGGERMLTERAVEAAGGHGALDQLERGRSLGGGASVVRLELGGELLEELVLQSEGMGGGSAPRRINPYLGVAR
jgi:hypothetical protein